MREAFPPLNHQRTHAVPSAPPSVRSSPGRTPLLTSAISHAPGVLLALGIGQVSNSLAQWLGLRAGSLALSIVLGIAILNGPFTRLFPRARFEAGLRLVTGRLLKLAVILSGLKAQVALFDKVWLAESLAILVVTLPVAFAVARYISARLGLRAEVGHLIGIGTMICGASAINALAPMIRAERSEQGLAITAVSTFSVAAMFVFLPLGALLHLSPRAFGMWSGLSIGDFSTAVAVGAQFSDSASIVATASKSLRVLLLGPMLVFFNWRVCAAHSRVGSDAAPSVASVMRNVPGFVFGYLLCCAIRGAGDRLFVGAPAWRAILVFNNQAFGVLMLSVCAAIGLGIDWRAVRSVGWRVVLAGGVSAATMAGLTLWMAWALADREHALVLVSSLAAAGLAVLIAVRRRQAHGRL